MTAVLLFSIAFSLAAALGGAALALLQPGLSGHAAGLLAWTSEALERLPKPRPAESHELSIGPDGYDIEAIVGVDQLVSGRVVVTYTNQSQTALDRLVFHLPRGLQSVSVETVDGAQAGQPERDGLTLTIPLNAPLAPNSQVKAVLGYSTFLAQSHRRQGISGGGGIWLVNDWYPSLDVFDGERWHDGEGAAFGDYSFLAAAPYKVRLTTPPGLAVFGPYGQRGQVVSGDEMSQTVALETGKVRECALVLTMSHQTLVEMGRSDPTVVALYLDGHEAGARAAVAAARRALDCYSRLFGPYPGPAFMVVEAPISDFKGVEFPGFILLSAAEFERPAEAEGVVVHEVAHQWWYNLIGSDQLEEPWIDEALASYSTALYYEKEYGPAAGRAVLSGGAFALYDARRSAYPRSYVAKPLTGFASDEEYKMMVYGRGGLFIGALREALGDQQFLTFLSDLAADHADGYITEKSLLDEAEMVSGRELGGLFDRWLRAPDGGFSP